MTGIAKLRLLVATVTFPPLIAYVVAGVGGVIVIYVLSVLMIWVLLARHKSPARLPRTDLKGLRAQAIADQETRADAADWRRIRQLEWELSGRYYHRLDGSFIPEGHDDAQRKEEAVRTPLSPYDATVQMEHANRMLARMTPDELAGMSAHDLHLLFERAGLF